MRFRVLITTLLYLLLGNSCLANYLHPQDGPHADLRVAIEDKLVRFSVGVNLAFLDDTIDVPREALNELSPEESERLLNELRQLLINQAPCMIDGELVEPNFERLEIFTDPDPGIIAIFPKMGARALIRATAVMRFDAQSMIETVELTWPAYPLDQLAQEMEDRSTVPPRMYFEAVMTANGKTKPARFTHAEPTLQWSRSDNASPDPLNSLPYPTITRSSNRTFFVTAFFLGFGLITLGYGFFIRRRPTMARELGVTCMCLFIAVLYYFVIAPNLQEPAPALIAEEDAIQIQRTLHENMYRAFDYTAESDIYDRLEFALHGDLLGELYEQIRLSLLQAEEEMKVGVVTGLQHIETNVIQIDAASESPNGLGFEAKHRWRVDGTVYHWGHSHTRAHLYEAAYRVTYTQNGWRMTEHELLSQRRIDPTDGKPVDEVNTLQEQLKELGFPDI